MTKKEIIMQGIYAVPFLMILMMLNQILLFDITFFIVQGSVLLLCGLYCAIKHLRELLLSLIVLLIVCPIYLAVLWLIDWNYYKAWWPVYLLISTLGISIEWIGNLVNKILKLKT